MTEETALSKVDDETRALLVSNDEDLDSLAKNVGFLPTLKLFNPQARAVVEGKIPGANFGLVKTKDEIKDMGQTVELIPIKHRAKAVEKIQDKYLSYYVRGSEQFLRTEEKAKDKKSGCLAGVEFLFWIPSEETFAYWYAFNTSTLGIIKQVRACYMQPAIMQRRLIKTPDYSWWAPTITLSPTEVKMYSESDLKSRLQSFNNPKEGTLEVDSESGTQERAT